MTLRKTVRQMVKEELGKRLVAEVESGEVPPRFARSWIQIPASRREAFGAYIKRQFGQKEPGGPGVPDDVPAKDVIAYLDANVGVPDGKSVPKVSVTGLVDMFKASPGLAKGLNRLGDDDFDNLETAAASGAVKKYQRGDQTLATTGAALNVTPVGAKKIGDKGQDYYRKFYAGKMPDDVDDNDPIFAKFDEAVNDAADMYAKILVAAKGKTPKVFAALRAAGALQANEEEQLSEVEHQVVAHLGELAVKGKVDKVKELLKRDIDRPLDDSNIVKSFQNLVSKLVRKGLDATSVAAGEKRSRGRPKG